jgi:hypothetical protein
MQHLASVPLLADPSGAIYAVTGPDRREHIGVMATAELATPAGAPGLARTRGSDHPPATSFSLRTIPPRDEDARKGHAWRVRNSLMPAASPFAAVWATAQARPRMPRVGEGFCAAGITLLGRVMGMRRQPNLRRLVRRRSFQQLHAVSVEWMERHFELIDASAPGLERIGTEVRDWCRGSARWLGLEPGFPATAGCGRSLTVVYGFDGRLLTVLDVLGEAVFAAGWGKLKNERRGSRPVRQLWVALTGQELVEHMDSEFSARVVYPEWRPNSVLGRPAGMEGRPPWGKPPLSPRMSVSCVSRGQGRRVMPTDHLDIARRAPRNYLLLEKSEVEQQALEDHALAAHEHAVAVNITLSYYSNPNVKARPHRIPRYWLPTRARW